MPKPSPEAVVTALSAPPNNLGFTAANIHRMMAYNDSLTHWLDVGFSFYTSHKLADAKHGLYEADRADALAYVLRNTNLCEKDLI